MLKAFVGMALLLAVAMPTLGATVQRDIPYVANGVISQRLDACVPEGTGPFPIIIMVHGGGWSTGDKAADFTQLFGPLTDAGFTWFSINYRLAPQYKWPDCLEDVQSALKWVREHATQYKGDPSRICLMGYSAGGHLVCQTVMLAQGKDQVQAVVGLSPPTDMVADTTRRGGLSPSLQNLLGHPKEVDPAVAAELAQISPITYIRSGLPPFFIMQGTADKSVPFTQTLNFQQQLQSVGVPSELALISNAPHNINLWKALEPSYPAQIIAWLAVTLKAGNKQ